MEKCPFHANSTGAPQRGEINDIQCPTCGDYRISSVALEQLAANSNPPSGWSDRVAKGGLISTRDTRQLRI